MPVLLLNFGGISEVQADDVIVGGAARAIGVSTSSIASMLKTRENKTLMRIFILHGVSLPFRCLADH